MLSDSSDEKDCAEDAEQDDFIRLMGDKRAKRVAVARGNKKDDKYSCACNAYGYDYFQRATTNQENRDQWEIYGHHEVFKNKNREDSRRFWCVHALEFGKQARDDARGCDERDAAEKDRGERRPAKEKSGDEAWREVKREVDRRARSTSAQSLGEILARVLETKHEEEKEHANFGAQLNEVFGEVERKQAAIPKSKSREEIEGDCRETEPASETREEGEPDRSAAQLDEQMCVVGWRCVQ